MQIPDQVKKAIDGNSKLTGLLNYAITACSPIISNKPEFFPEYTDHGPDHNTEVLSTAIDILKPDTVEAMTPEDITVLALSVLLHDCGMHMTGDSFVSLISGDNRRTTKLDERTWLQLWNEFILEVKRFDGKQNRRVFGSPEPVAEPPSDPAEYTLKHRLLIGEFLRRHHPRLAHEIAIFGFPAIDGTRIELFPTVDDDLPEVSGLVARSHGMSLRLACDYFSEHFHEREYQGIHPPIIMAALRIADYLQVQPDRAPKSVLRVHRMRSPFSAGEWRVHQSVRNITPADNDPEAVYVDAKPTNVETFLKFQSWAKGFQSELDATWAALGEVYGRFTQQGFDKFGLRLRRLRTSVDNVMKFSRSVDYVPAQIAFEASNADLLSLLVAPLYGDRPEIGLRELIQNSLDAVRERTHIEGKAPSEQLNGHDTDVIVYPVVQEDEVRAVVIEDRGIGMDVDILQNYFLRAGASFRNSAQWKKTFTTETGESEIARTGRFGVGALAGFLLGDTITVETRRLGEERGLVFDAELDQESIELKHCEREVGTKITVRVGEDKQQEVKTLFSNPHEYKKWDWYCLKSPSLLRLDTEGEEIEPEFLFADSSEWKSVDTQSMERVAWAHKSVRYEQRYSRTKSRCLYVNGIFVQELKEYSDDPQVLDSRELSKGVTVSSPTILLTDHNGQTNLNLQRDRLTKTDVGLSSALRKDLALDLIAQALAFAPEQPPFSKSKPKKQKYRTLSAGFSLAMGERATYRTTDLRSPWCWEDGGWRLAEPTLALKKNRMLAIYGDYDLSFLESCSELLLDTSIVWVNSNANSNSKGSLKEALRHFTRDRSFLGRSGPKSFKGHIYPVGFELVVSSSVFEKLSESDLPNYLSLILNSKRELDGKYVCLRNLVDDDELSSRMKTGLASQPSNGFAYALVGGENQHSLDERDLFSHLWLELVGEEIIPVCFEDREKAFPKAFDQLGKRIRLYRDKLH
ncbi:HD domain-containing protein [Ruegeria atlantica]|uniref:HD domain-containing protein n=1 Tax=Ruegeria atlantica TaxID=81569 RepID=UPI00147BC418|nr:ATP-binding protein [Ruegeria atlantica]